MYHTNHNRLLDYFTTTTPFVFVWFFQPCRIPDSSVPSHDLFSPSLGAMDLTMVTIRSRVCRRTARGVWIMSSCSSSIANSLVHPGPMLKACLQLVAMGFQTIRKLAMAFATLHLQLVTLSEQSHRRRWLGMFPVSLCDLGFAPARG
jgi:hypothetical protein